MCSIGQGACGAGHRFDIVKADLLVLVDPRQAQVKNRPAGGDDAGIVAHQPDMFPSPLALSLYPDARLLLRGELVAHQRFEQVAVFGGLTGDDVLHL